MIARYLVGLVEFNDAQKKAADFNEDGEINNVDLSLWRATLWKLIKKLRVRPIRQVR
jgi:hypothetical protein